MLADRIAQILGIDRVIVPRNVGQFSALGLLRSDLMVTRAQSIMTALNPANAEVIEAGFRALEEQVTADLVVFAMYRGQTWDNRIPIQGSTFDEDGAGQLEAGFHRFYEESYGFSAAELPVVVSTLEVTAIIPRDHGVSEVEAEAGEAHLRDIRLAVPGSEEWTDAPVYARQYLQPGQVVNGPCLVVEEFATTLVLPNRCAHLDDAFNLVIESQS